MKHPAIRIYDSFLLNNAVVPLLRPQLDAAGRGIEAEPEFIEVKADEYRTAWAPYEPQIVPAMCDVLGVEFAQNVIDAYVAPFAYSFSNPMVISTKHSGDRFIEVFTHELSHRLLTDNDKYRPGLFDWRLLDSWIAMFGAEHSRVTHVHIPVHALLEHIFIDILKEPARLKRDKEITRQYPDYHNAWKYVEEVGYKKILFDLKVMYASLT